jgi:hypothetical protein
MSSSNGNRSRFHRIRKQKIARRMRNRALLTGIGNHPRPAAASSDSKPKAAIG